MYVWLQTWDTFGVKGTEHKNTFLTKELGVSHADNSDVADLEQFLEIRRDTDTQKNEDGIKSSSSRKL